MAITAALAGARSAAMAITFADLPHLSLHDGRALSPLELLSMLRVGSVVAVRFHDQDFFHMRVLLYPAAPDNSYPAIWYVWTPGSHIHTENVLYGPHYQPGYKCMILEGHGPHPTLLEGRFYRMHVPPSRASLRDAILKAKNRANAECNQGPEQQQVINEVGEIEDFALFMMPPPRGSRNKKRKASSMMSDSA